MRCNGARVIRYGTCTRMHIADFLFISLCYVSHLRLFLSVRCLFFTLHLSSSCLFVFLPPSLSDFLSFLHSLCHTHTNTEVIISGRLGVKVCYDKHAAVVINFEQWQRQTPVP